MRVFQNSRIQQARQTKSDYLVTACPFCVVCLEDSAKSKNGCEIEVLDLAEVVSSGIIVEETKRHSWLKSLYGVKEETKNILVYIEHFGEEIESVSLEMLSKGRELADQVGWELVGLLLGRDVGKYLDVVFAHGADKVILVEHRLLDHFTVDAYSHAVFQVLESHLPSIFLLGATANGRDLAGRLAVRLKTGLNADCTDLRIDPDNGVLVCEVSGFGSGVLALIDIPNHRPQMATVRPGVFSIKVSAGVKQSDVVDFEVKIESGQH